MGTEKTVETELTFIVGGAKAYRQGHLYEPGEKITLPPGVLPSRTWTWPSGAPVRFGTEAGKRVLLPEGPAPAKGQAPAKAGEPKQGRLADQ